MRFVKSTPDEFLVLGRRGRLSNLGLAARVLLRPGDSYVRVSGAKQEACFAMTQESKDGIPLRFKGLVLYRVVDPVATATAFDFARADGREKMEALIEHVCLGALRDVVSRMDMQACIEGRRTTLSEAVGEALARIVEGDGGRSWGIALDVVQVSQVFIVDDALRARLETERRNEVIAVAERSDLLLAEALEVARLESEHRTTEASFEREREAIRLQRERLQLEQAAAKQRIEGEAQIDVLRGASQIQREEEEALARRASARRIEAQALEDDRTAHDIARERLGFEQALEAERAQTEARTRTHTITAERPVLVLDVEVQRLRNELMTLQVDAELFAERARAELERDLLPQRQVPEVAHALAAMFQGADLTLYGADNMLACAVAPLIDMLGRQIRGPLASEGE